MSPHILRILEDDTPCVYGRQRALCRPLPTSLKVVVVADRRRRLAVLLLIFLHRQKRRQWQPQ